MRTTASVFALALVLAACGSSAGGSGGSLPAPSGSHAHPQVVQPTVGAAQSLSQAQDPARDPNAHALSLAEAKHQGAGGGCGGLGIAGGRRREIGSSVVNGPRCGPGREVAAPGTEDLRRRLRGSAGHAGRGPHRLLRRTSASSTGTPAARATGAGG